MAEAVPLLAEAGDREVAPRLASLLERELAASPIDPLARQRIEALGDAFVRLDGAASDEQRKRFAEVDDPGSAEYRAGLVRRLDALATHRGDVEAWAAAAAAPHPELRRLAYRKLGEIGGPAAAAALVSAFGRVDPAEGAAVLEALAVVETPEAAATVERVLTDPAFDHVHRRPLRRAAEWAARQKGRADLLRRAIELRDGRDPWPMIYLAVLEGERALPVLEEYRLRRLRHLSPDRSGEQEWLDWLAREIRHERSIGRLDVRPDDEIFTLPP
jgi:hypothetical protein